MKKKHPLLDKKQTKFVLWKLFYIQLQMVHVLQCVHLHYLCLEITTRPNACINISNQGPLPLVRDEKGEHPWERKGGISQQVNDDVWKTTLKTLTLNVEPWKETDVSLFSSPPVSLVQILSQKWRRRFCLWRFFKKPKKLVLQHLLPSPPVQATWRQRLRSSFTLLLFQLVQLQP